VRDVAIASADADHVVVGVVGEQHAREV